MISNLVTELAREREIWAPVSISLYTGRLHHWLDQCSLSMDWLARRKFNPVVRELVRGQCVALILILQDDEARTRDRLDDAEGDESCEN